MTPCGTCGRERRGDNLLKVYRRDGQVDHRCRHCHNRRQREYLARKAAREQAAGAR